MPKISTDGETIGFISTFVFHNITSLFQLAQDTQSNVGNFNSQRDALLPRIKDLLSWLQDCQQRLDGCKEESQPDEQIVQAINDCDVSDTFFHKQFNFICSVSGYKNILQKIISILLLRYLPCFDHFCNANLKY